MSDNESQTSSQTVSGESDVDTINRIKHLIDEREIIVAKLTRFVQFVKDFDEQRLIELETRLDHAADMFTKFDMIQTQIETLNPSEITLDTRESFENSYYKVVATARKLIVKSHSDINNRLFQEAQTNTISQVHSRQNNLGRSALPPIDLPRFSGDYKTWLFFIKRFKALVDSNTQLSKVEKLYYLQGRLEGEAAEIIQDIELNDENYEIALKLLTDRFENKKVIIDQHIDDLFNLPTVAKESHVHLRKLIDSFKQHLRSLKSLGEPTDSWDKLLIHLLKIKLDETTRDRWQEKSHSSSKKTAPTLSEFLEFLVSRCEFLESLDKVKLTQSNQHNSHHSKGHFPKQHSFHPKTHSSHSKLSHTLAATTSVLNASTSESRIINCFYCKQDHAIYRCSTFLQLALNDKYKEIRKLELCSNCLRKGHFKDQCNSRGCRICNGKHNTILHPSTLPEANSSSNSINNNSGQFHPTTSPGSSQFQSSATNTTVTSVCCHSMDKLVLLSTASILVKDIYGNSHPARALLDAGSQSNYMTHSLLQKLHLCESNVNISISGVGQNALTVFKRAEADISSRDSKFQTQLQFLILPEITDKIPNVHFNLSDLNIPKHILLADPVVNKPGDIDILLGASLFYELLNNSQISLGKGKPLLPSTKLGWILTGSIHLPSIPKQQQSFCALNLNQQLTKFWELEEVVSKKHLSAEEKFCEAIYKQTTTRDNEGRFIIKFPLNELVDQLGDSKPAALKRFHGIEKRFERDPLFKESYIHFINEYLTLNHMTLISSNSDDGLVEFYLPHHGVKKETSITTKLRVVYDGSAITDTGISLNQCLAVGPQIQDDLFNIIIRFRTHSYILTTDIEKMYRMVIVNMTEFPKACNVILRDFFVDDLITGADSVQEALQLKEEISSILHSGGFELRKWASNHPDIILSHYSEFQPFYEKSEFKTLGLIWNPEKDTLQYSVDFKAFQNIHVTKRQILSAISKIFDPLGLIGPLTISSKIILQMLWQCHAQWDDPVPSSLLEAWKSFTKNIHLINTIAIPRHVLSMGSDRIEIHAFSDASETAYGCCFYARSINSTKTKVQLLCAKSRVAPLKKTTLPRLELCGALLLSRLLKTIQSAFSKNIDQVFLYTDSKIVLAWIATQPSYLQTFVANRIAEITENTSISDWYHVRSCDNPADIISRGATPDQLISHDMWWNGPKFLQTNEYSPSPQDIDLTNILLPEIKIKSTIVGLTTTSSTLSMFNKYSSFTKLLRVTAYILRFKNNCLAECAKKIKDQTKVIKNMNQLTPLSTEELNLSLTVLVKVVQSQSFETEISMLSSNKPLPKSSRLLNLHPFLDKHHILRVGGRIQHSNTKFEHKHPIILPQTHKFTQLLILKEHITHLHASTQLLLSILRLRFWPLSGKNAVKRVLRDCIRCFKANPLSLNQLMGNLPADRFTTFRPFFKTGVDYAGPFITKSSYLRNAKLVKSYICLFVCLSTKALHIELVHSLSTEAFTNALKRFIGRRGKPSDMYSDNGTNFVGFDNELKQFLSHKDNNEAIHKFLSCDNINWHYLPGNSPHKGGLWEAAVKSAKYHLKRVMGNDKLTFDEMYTLLVQVEACLNSRPLTPLSNDPLDFSPLTPSHFLIGDSLVALPEANLTDIPQNRLTRFRRLQQIQQHFWTRWSKEYLHQLQTRSKWQKVQPNSIQVGSLVILKEDNLPPLRWCLGRIVELFPSQDNLTRVVSVKMSNGSILKRSITKICVLPLDCE